MSSLGFEWKTVASPSKKDDEEAGKGGDKSMDYGYEATEDVGAGITDSHPAHSGGDMMRDTSEQRSVKRRGVVTAENTLFDLSYHPGRIRFYSPPRQRQVSAEI